MFSFICDCLNIKINKIKIKVEHIIVPFFVDYSSMVWLICLGLHLMRVHVEVSHMLMTETKANNQRVG